MTIYFHGGAFHELPAGCEMPAGAHVVPRMPGPAETWNPATQAFECDGEAKADMAVPQGHIAKMHVLKTLEAHLILSGHALPAGLLAMEAAATGEDIEALAQAVSDNAAAALAMEVERRSAKVQARAS